MPACAVHGIHAIAAKHLLAGPLSQEGIDSLTTCMNTMWQSQADKTTCLPDKEEQARCTAPNRL